MRNASSLSADAQGQRPSAAGLTPYVWIAEVNNLFRGRVEVLLLMRVYELLTKRCARLISRCIRKFSFSAPSRIGVQTSSNGAWSESIGTYHATVKSHDACTGNYLTHRRVLSSSQALSDRR